MLIDIHIPQFMIMNEGYHINYNDAALLQAMNHLMGFSKGGVIASGGIIYKNITYDEILREVPMLGKIDKDGNLKQISKNALYRRLKRLVGLGFLSKINSNNKTGLPYYTTTKKLEALYRG
jgi:hypothetical protein